MIMSSPTTFVILFLFSFLTSFRASAQDPTYLRRLCRKCNLISVSERERDDSLLGRVYAKIEFKDLVLSPVNQTATMASNSSQKFDARKAYFNAFQDLYALVQCTPDLTSQECFHCLNWTINRLPIHRVGGRIFVPSCNSRFELYSFYNESAVPTSQQQLDSAPPPPQQISISSPFPGGGGNSTVVIIAVVVTISVIFLLLVAVYTFRAKREKTVYETEPLADGEDITTAGSLQFDFKAIKAATDKFSEGNKLGQGGFGLVYKRLSFVAVVTCLQILGSIISGKKNSSLYQMDGSAGNLITYTWRLWDNGSPLELMDPLFQDNYETNEITRCIHIALLCVQEEAEDRPTLNVQMLTTSLIDLAVPQPPGIFFGRRHEEVGRSGDSGPSMHISAHCSVDDASITSVAPR
ncbi:LOW QUALITY PROTEIN: hypothetical protein HID58_041510 [Brassica napus]|uniref:Gnk2-homologous domain-containing protein n=1 Tax=Brassica napus TaxID=3708 RepID=A0ABQ8BB14_BRANA|nr:LOW QUALITY PROTEIN: hypothetical protein HID58_041510 [Brassica napus]